MGFDALQFNRGACVHCEGKCEEYVWNVDSGQPGQCLQCGCDTFWHTITPCSTAVTCSRVTHSYMSKKHKIFMETASQPMETTGGGTGRRRGRRPGSGRGAASRRGKVATAQRQATTLHENDGCSHETTKTNQNAACKSQLSVTNNGGRTFEATKKLKHAEKETGHEGVEENQGYGANKNVSAGSSEVNEDVVGAAGVDLTYFTNSQIPMYTADVDYSAVNEQEFTSLDQVVRMYGNSLTSLRNMKSLGEASQTSVNEEQTDSQDESLGDDYSQTEDEFTQTGLSSQNNDDMTSTEKEAEIEKARIKSSVAEIVKTATEEQRSPTTQNMVNTKSKRAKKGPSIDKKVNDAFRELQAAMGLAGSPGSKEMDKADVVIQPYTNDAIQALEGLDQKRYMEAFDTIVQETANWICPTPIEVATGIPEHNCDAFLNRAVYQNFCQLLVKKFTILGSHVMIDDYRRKKWRQMKMSGEPPADWPTVQDLKNMKKKKRTADCAQDGTESDDSGEENFIDDVNVDRHRNGNADSNGNNEENQSMKNPQRISQRPMYLIHGWKYFAHKLNTALRGRRTRRSATAVNRITTMQTRLSPQKVNMSWNDRKSMPSAYGILETRAQKQVIALFNGSAEGVNDTNMEKHFKDSFALRTQMIQLDPHVDYVVQKFPVLQIVDYICLETKLMAGEEAFTLIQENASKYFAAVEAFGKHQNPYLSFKGAAKYVCGKIEPEFKEVTTEAEMSEALSTNNKYPILIIHLDSEGEPDQVIVKIEKVLIRGSSNWRDGAMYLLLSYIVFGITLTGRSQFLRLLEYYLLGIETGKGLQSQTKKFYVVLKSTCADVLPLVL